MISISRRTLRWTAVGAGAAVVGTAWMILRPGSSPGADDKTIECGAQVITINGDDNDVGDLNQQFENCLGPNPDQPEVEDVAEKFDDIDPPGAGPWPFYISVSDIGLIVRTSGDADGKQVGSAGDGATVWAECREQTDFTPPADEDMGPVWLRIRWPNNTAGDRTFYNSSPSDSYTAYIYESYATPAGHNGKIPDC